MSALRQEIGFDEIMLKIDRLQETIAKLAVDQRPEWYSLRQCAEHRGKSLRTIQRKVARGELGVTRRHGERMVHRDDI